MLRKVEPRLGVAGDWRPASTTDVIRFRLLMIACGYEDAIDVDSLRGNPAFKMAVARLPSAADLYSQSTISRLENRPNLRTLVQMPRR